MGTSKSKLLCIVAKKDHPHAYGDKYCLLFLAAQLLGSSPRVWGQAATVSPTAAGTGIIPTRMGTSFHHDIRRPTDKGSSPRVWGQVRNSRFTAGDTGIIPTRMGTSEGDICEVTVFTDHPHAYGDKTGLTDKNGKKIGSSPRVWGQVLGRFCINRDAGIIPTRMGTSPFHLAFILVVKDHPHAYGDKS